MRLLELPVELQRLVLQRVPLRTLLRARQCSWLLHDMILEDVRWLPIVAPPSLENQTLSLAEHASHLITLYGRYQHWLAKCEELIDNTDLIDDAEEQLRLMNRAIDGFFALAPWTRVGADGPPLCFDGDGSGEWAPLPWMQRMAYAPAPSEPPLPEELGGGGRRRSARLRPPPAEQRMSRFYQQRERDDDDAFRTFFSVPVGISEALRERRPRATRFHIQPLSIVSSQSGLPDSRLPELSASALAALATARALLDCYLPQCLGGGEGSVSVGALESVAVDTSKYVRRDAQKAFAGADGTIPVYQLLISALAGVEREAHWLHVDVDDVDEQSFAVYVVGSHLRPVDALGRPHNHLDWVFSSPVDASPRASRLTPWAVSTFQLEGHLDHSERLRTRVLCKDLLYCILGNGVGLELCCESAPCALNNCDSVGESAATSLLLCPCCLRKLQILGLMPDVPACLGRLQRLLSSPALREVSHADLCTLEQWGHGRSGAPPGSSGAPIHV